MEADDRFDELLELEIMQQAIKELIEEKSKELKNKN